MSTSISAGVVGNLPCFPFFFYDLLKFLSFTDTCLFTFLGNIIMTSEPVHSASKKGWGQG